MQYSQLHQVIKFANKSQKTFDDELLRRKYENHSNYGSNKYIRKRETRETREILSMSPQITDALNIMSQVSISPSLGLQFTTE